MSNFDDDLLNTPINGYLNEMAGRIPGDAKIPGDPKAPGLIIAVGDGERDIQHFHVFRSEKDRENWSNGACLFFKENRYYDHSKNSTTLSKDELNAVNQKLKEQYPKAKFHGTNWEYLLDLWNNNNYRYPIDPDLPITEYDYKTIKCYKEGDPPINESDDFDLLNISLDSSIFEMGNSNEDEEKDLLDTEID